MGKIKVGFIGFGNRGSMYGQYAKENENRCEIVALVDRKLELLDYQIKKYQFPYVYREADDFFEAKHKLDLICISSMDKYHFDHCKKSIELGYNILLEKPISCTIEEVLELQKLAKEKNVKIIVCHVLRYTLFYKQLHELISSGVAGDIVNINATENVAYWHQCHSYVRGNWKSKEETGPQILTKCSHDMDIIQWLMGKTPTLVSSFGSLHHFKKENKPVNSGSRCCSCPIQKECNFDAYKFYIPNPQWLIPFNGEDISEESISKFLSYSDFGRCAYDMDNDVVDHQVVNLQFEDGTTASLTCNAFSKLCYRDIKIFGTKASIVGDFEEKKIYVRKYNQENEVIDIQKLTTDFSGHGGGDRIMFNEVLDYILTGKKTDSLTILDDSVISHVMAFKAEESRIKQGLPLELNIKK